MGNADAKVQAVADFVTGSNREDGFANAIEHFILRRDITMRIAAHRPEPVDDRA
jgi:hypothetical protein